MWRRLAKALALIGVLLAGLVAAVYWYARQSLPVVDGKIHVPGHAAPIDIVRDADDVPHILASNIPDALYGLGYVHAQDRLWQMEFQRRAGFGRLSEIFGAATLPQDWFLRTVGFGRAARATWDRLPPETRALIDAYVAGVNAFLATHGGRRLPPEFTILGFQPDPWTGPDVVVWQKMMAWDLSANYAAELLRDDIGRAVGPERLADLMPTYPDEGSSIVSETSGKAAASPVASGFSRSSALDALVSGLSQGEPAVRDMLTGGSTTESLGSNNWVIDGTISASGKPLLANDPHLNARVPSIWYLAHLSAGDYDVIGASLPGTPAIVLGRNRFIAWGATNVGADVEDLYRERIDESGRFAEFEGRLEPLQLVTETIGVKGRAPEVMHVRTSRHGPLVSDAINANTGGRRIRPLALRWTGLDANDTTVSAMLRVTQARNWNEFTSALGEFVVPSQNFVYADVAGHIGYYAPGRIPIRANGNGGVPSEGWTGKSEWTGWIPFDSLPHVFDPPSHFIVTANQRPMPADYPFLLGTEWPEPYRATRISELLRAGASRGLGPADFEAIQGDTISLHARTLLPILLAHARPQEAGDIRAVGLLNAWNFDVRGDSAPAAIFEAWFLHLTPVLIGDSLPGGVRDRYRERFSSVTRFIIRTLERDPHGWCTHSCDAAVTQALHNAVIELASRMPGDMARWRWDLVHHALFPHQGLDGVAALRPLFSRSVASSGDWSTVDVGAVWLERAYDQRAIAGYRQIVDLSAGNGSLFTDALGESGHPLSKHYDDFLSDWRLVKYRRMRVDRADIEKGATGHLRVE